MYRHLLQIVYANLVDGKALDYRFYTQCGQKKTTKHLPIECLQGTIIINSEYQKLLVRIHTSFVVNLETKSSNQWLNKIIESMTGSTTVPPPIRPLCKNMVCMHEIASCHEGDNKIPEKCGCSSDFPQPPKSSMLTVV